VLRRTAQTIAAVVVSVLAAGCDDHADIGNGPMLGAASPCRVGGDNNRRRIFFRARPTGSQNHGQALHYQNGVSYLLVDDSCRFFVSYAPDSDYGRWPALRTGTLMPAEAASLAQGSNLGNWTGLLGNWESQDTLDHPLIYEWSDGSLSVGCPESCRGGTTPAAMGHMRDVTIATLQALWQRGQSVAGPAVRVRVLPGDWVFYDRSILPEPIVWTLNVAIDRLIIPSAGYPGGAAGILVKDASDAAKLRASYAPFQDGQYPDWRSVGAYLPFRRPESSAQRVDAAVFLRETIPFEDAAGSLSMRW
jgi:hypothetical protein